MLREELAGYFEDNVNCLVLCFQIHRGVKVCGLVVVPGHGESIIFFDRWLSFWEIINFPSLVDVRWAGSPQLLLILLSWIKVEHGSEVVVGISFDKLAGCHVQMSGAHVPVGGQEGEGDSDPLVLLHGEADARVRAVEEQEDQTKF